MKAADGASAFDAQLEPDDASLTLPHLIEPPIVVTKSDASY